VVARDTPQARRAAVLLHELPEVARQQVFAKLDGSQAARLRPLLDELSQLDPWPKDCATVERARRLRPEDVAVALGSCAPMTVALLLRAVEWHWKAQVLERLPRTVRTHVFECLRTECPQLAPAVLQVLCKRLCDEVTRQTRQHSAGRLAGPGVMARIRRLIGWTP
jgi:Mg/Co/Ni transporter MgtE